MFPAYLLALALCPPGPRDNCVVDGDTFWIKGEKVRIADIDAPEIDGKCPYERDLALRARNRLAQLLSPSLSLQRTGTDQYGRTLAVVSMQGRSAGAQLVAEGLASVWTGRREPWC